MFEDNYSDLQTPTKTQKKERVKVYIRIRPAFEDEIKDTIFDPREG